MIACRLATDASIPAHLQPAQVLDYARSRDADDGALLRGTGIAAPAANGLPAASLLTAEQYLRLLTNALRALDSPDTSFMLGQQLLPGHDGALSHALLQAPSLRHALTTICAGHARLTPLLQPRLHLWDEGAGLVWTDSFGAHSLRPALVEMHMTAVVALCRWLGGTRLPWRFTFNRGAPRHVEQHEVHLGGALRFGCHVDAMLIDGRWLDVPWPRGSSLAAALALRQVAEEAAQPAGLLAVLYDYLLERVRAGPTLERTAADFGVSPATLKRQLQRHGTHFQAELDQVRTHVALWLFHTRRAGNDAVAQYLGFHDGANFRRSFKRWTGQTPTLLRMEMDVAGAAVQ
ncbi:AraC family transcriptional regulator ligand-binding domain-containing protein [Pseudoduganella plicata]|uniref:AraC family transcriptional regulator n=1 Tax=Pseudoduganella plicata TaxID=321984 RepID=A0A4P7BBL5_9BURK|nr:AraC family transcriptional regulator [Pseudoduganella plicata]QBQ35322.1 AraC family transcriptional regulator [Pseudoduganella plicata]GGZ00876.1 AraC family transcriptional regulator [Pseudoduganella plicata]